MEIESRQPRRDWPGSDAVGLLRDPLRTLERLAADGRSPILVRVAWRRLAFLADPDDVRAVFVDQRAALAKGDTLDGLRLVVGSGLVTADGPEHLRQRRSIAPAFSPGNADRWATAVADTAETHLSRWTGGDERAVDEEMLALALVAAGRALFDRDLTRDAAAVGSAIRTLADMSGLASLPFAGVAARTPLPIARRFRAARAVLDDVVAPIVDGATGAAPGSLLAAIAAAARDWPATERRGALRDHVVTFLVAGHVTTGNAIAWALHLLASDVAAADRLRGEVDRVTGGAPVRGVDADRLPYARAAFAEALRLYPPAWAIGRRAVADIQVGRTRIREGSLIVACPWLTHRDARWYPEPLRFDPERWLTDGAWDGRAVSPSRAPAYYPFGIGSRKCIGEPLAWLEGTLILAAVARRWVLSPTSGAPVVPRPEITLSPRGGLPMRVVARTGGGPAPA